MTIYGAWWLLLCFSIGFIVALIAAHVDGPDGGMFPGLSTGCFVAAGAIVGGTMLGLLLWALDVSITLSIS